MNRPIRISVLAPVLAASMQPAPSAAQELRAVTLPARVACAECTVVFDTLFIIEDTEPYWLGDRLTLSKPDSRGRYHGSSFFTDPGVIQVVDQFGRRVGNYGHGSGAGPGEGRGMTAPYIAPGDTAYVWDFLQRRITVWAPDEKLVRQFNAPGRISSVLFLDSGDLLLGATVQTRAHAGLPLHIVNRVTGEIAHSFGADPPTMRFDNPSLITRYLARSNSGGFLAAHASEYVIEVWDSNRRKRSEIRRVVDWFSSDRSTSDDDSYVTAVWQDRQGLIWIVVDTPDANRAENEKRLEDRGDGMGKYSGPADWHGLNDTVIEVIDPDRGVVVASRRFEEYITTQGAGAPLIVYRADAEGNPRFDVLVPRLVQRGRDFKPDPVK